VGDATAWQLLSLALSRNDPLAEVTLTHGGRNAVQAAKPLFGVKATRAVAPHSCAAVRAGADLFSDERRDRLTAFTWKVAESRVVDAEGTPFRAFTLRLHPLS
jgi:hypothetical protein